MSRKVLVVDESPAVRSILQIYLRDGGCTILEAESAERALQVLHLVKVDLVIASMKTPRMGGLGLIRALRKDEASNSRQAPVLLLAADMTPATAQEAAMAGAVAVLKKPVSGASLVQTIEGVLGPAPRPPTVPSGGSPRGTGRHVTSTAAASTAASTVASPGPAPR